MSFWEPKFVIAVTRSEMYAAKCCEKLTLTFTFDIVARHTPHVTPDYLTECPSSVAFKGHFQCLRVVASQTADLADAIKNHEMSTILYATNTRTPSPCIRLSTTFSS